MGNSIKIDGVTITRGNTKIGRTLNVSLPPEKTCNHNMPCYKENVCYALRSCYNLYKGVRSAWDSNWKALVTNRPAYFMAIEQALDRSNLKFFRWHVGGDIPDADYLRHMVVVAQNHKDVIFWATTKKYDLARLVRNERRIAGQGCKFPANFNLVLSAWPGVPLHPSTKTNWPTAWMLDTKNPDPRIPSDAHHCDGGCDVCGLCAALKPGQSVVFEKH